MTSTITDQPRDGAVLALDAHGAADRALAGGKAAALARAAAAGVPTLPGHVLTTAFCGEVDAGTDVAAHPAIAEVWAAIGAEAPLVARSSSVVEDAADSSQAGQFESVLGIAGREALEDAVRTVLGSRRRAGAADHPIAVLVQPMVEPELAGVLFGIDPVTGRSDRRVATAVAGQPDALVSGEVDGSRYEIEPDGTVVDRQVVDGVRIPDGVLLGLADLADRVADLFGGPQDVEWAVVEGRLVLLQSRPVTTPIRGVPQGPVYGPGPVAETFPEPLSTLECGLWVPPLREAVREALRLAAAVPPGDLDGPDLVIAVDGNVAIDLQRTGEIERDGGNGRLGIAGRIRRLRSAWRVGRLRTSLPGLGRRVLDLVDDDLEALPPLTKVSDRQLVGAIARSQDALRSLHAHEMLIGLLGDEGRGRLTGASVAMRVLTEARSDGRSDDEILQTSPVVLALTPPRICERPQLPDESRTPDLAPPLRNGRSSSPRQPEDPAVIREALRLRVRWVQELGARAAWELGRRLVRAGQIEEERDVRWLSLQDLVALVTKRAQPLPAVLRRVADERSEPEPLPARFRLSDRGRPVPHLDGDAEGGTGAAGGEATGTVTHDADDPSPGAVLVVRTLRPDLGPVLPRLSGLVAETGSVLAHLAILAREADLPTVVGFAGALDQLPEGTTVTVDGRSGRVTVHGDDARDQEAPR